MSYDAYCSKKGLFVLLDLLLVAGGDSSGCSDDTKHTEGHARVESSLAWLLSGGGGRPLGKNLLLLPIDSCAFDGFLSKSSKFVEQILNLRSNFFLAKIPNLALNILVFRLELVANIEQSSSNIFHAILDIREPLVQFRFRPAFERDFHTRYVALRLSFCHCDGLADALSALQVCDNSFKTLGGQTPVRSRREPFAIDLDRLTHVVGKVTECFLLEPSLLCLPFGEFGCPLIHHLPYEVFTLLFVLLSVLTNVFKLFEVEVDGVAGKLVLLDRHLRKDLRDLLLLCLGDLLEETPHAPASFVCGSCGIWLHPGLTV